MTEIIALVLGVFLGILVMALLSADSYERGAEDEQLARDNRAAVQAEWLAAAQVRGY